MNVTIIKLLPCKLKQLGGKLIVRQSLDGRLWSENKRYTQYKNTHFYGQFQMIISYI